MYQVWIFSCSSTGVEAAASSAGDDAGIWSVPHWAHRVLIHHLTRGRAWCRRGLICHPPAESPPTVSNRLQVWGFMQRPHLQGCLIWPKTLSRRARQTSGGERRKKKRRNDCTPLAVIYKNINLLEDFFFFLKKTCTICIIETTSASAAVTSLEAKETTVF